MRTQPAQSVSLKTSTVQASCQAYEQAVAVLRKMREQSLKSVRERVLAGLVRKGVLEEQQRRKGGTYYAAAFFDPSLNTSSVRLHDAGAEVKASVVERVRAALLPQGVSDEAAAPAVSGRDVVLCALARYSDVIDEVTAHWDDEERTRAGGRLRALSEGMTAGQEGGQEVDSSLHWIVRHFTG